MDRLVRRMSQKLLVNNCEPLGIIRTQRLAKAISVARRPLEFLRRRRLFREKRETLLRENGSGDVPNLDMRPRGYAVDADRELPGVAALLEATDEIIAELRSGKREPARNKRYMTVVQKREDFSRYPSILNFATSSPVLQVVTDYLETIPILARVDLVESDSAKDTKQRYLGAQLFHRDILDYRTVFLTVNLQDVTEEHGPFCFLDVPDTAAVSAAIRYGARGVDYRQSDEDVFRHVSRDALVKAIHPRGVSYFVDGCRCLHYGSRDSVRPRYILRYVYTTVCRSDFGEVDERGIYSEFARADDSRLRRLVLDAE